jgi:hypothetical protein
LDQWDANRRYRRSPATQFGAAAAAIGETSLNPQNFDSITAQFYAAGLRYSAAIQPYALKLLVSLFLIEILITWIQYSAEGQLDPTYYFGRSFRHLMTSGFIYLMITNGFQWMYLIIQSFSRIGANFDWTGSA